MVVKKTGAPVFTQIEKMSKVAYNVVNPDDVVRELGADSMPPLRDVHGDPSTATNRGRMRESRRVHRFSAPPHGPFSWPKTVS